MNAKDKLKKPFTGNFWFGFNLAAILFVLIIPFVRSLL